MKEITDEEKQELTNSVIELLGLFAIPSTLMEGIDLIEIAQNIINTVEKFHITRKGKEIFNESEVFKALVLSCNRIVDDYKELFEISQLSKRLINAQEERIKRLEKENEQLRLGVKKERNVFEDLAFAEKNTE